MKRTVVGIDIAKRVFQLHRVEIESGEMVSVQLKRARFLEHFATCLPCLIGMRRAAVRNTGRASCRSSGTR